MEPTRPSLSEISHLFLSQLRESGGKPRPQRLPPGAPRPVCPEPVEAPVPANHKPIIASNDDSLKQVSAVIASHLAGDYRQRIGQYARYLAHQHGSVGWIELSDHEFSLTCFERGGSETCKPEILTTLDQTRIAQALGELAYDVKRWVISIADTTSDAARELLGQVPHWVLISSADNDGVVSCYRALKSLAEGSQPGLSLLVVDAAKADEADSVYRKIAGVSRQFLDYELEREPAITPVDDVAEQVLLRWQGTQELPAGDLAPRWQAVFAFLENSREPETDAPPQTLPATASPAIASPFTATSPSRNEDLPEVIDLPTGTHDDAVLSAILHQQSESSRWVQCPIKPPMCPNAILAVGRDRRLTLWAIAGKGLSQLPLISRAFHWMVENRELIRLAVPQVSIDAQSMPALRLLVDHADINANLLQPLLQNGTVTVEAYRKLRWGQRTGLLLEAA